MSHRSAALDRRRFIALAAAVAALPLGLPVIHPAAAQESSVRLALDWYPNANHAGIYLGQARGLFAAVGIDLEVYTPSDPTVVLQTVGAGQDTFGISYQTDVLLARAQGVPVVSVAALVQHPLLCVMSLQEAAISRPADLAGKSVGYPGIPSQEAFLATMLEADGLTAEDVSLVNVEFNLLPALLSGRASAVMGAYWTHETIIAEREGHPVDIMRVEDWGVPSYYELVLVTSEERLQDEPERVAAMLSALRAGYEAAIADPAAALEALVSTYPETDRAVEEQGLSLLVPAWTAGGVAFGTQEPARWTDYADWMKSRGLIPAELDPALAFRADLLPGSPATPVN